VLHAVVGDQLLINGVLGSNWKETLNFKGYAARPWSNDGQDMGWEIILDPESFIDKYRLPGPGKDVARYQVVRETVGARPASFFVDIEPRHVQSLKLVDAKGQPVSVRWASGGEVPLAPGEYAMADAQSNGLASRLLPVLGNRPLKSGEKFRVEAGRSQLLTLRQSTTFAGLGAMTLVPQTGARPVDKAVDKPGAKAVPINTEARPEAAVVAKPEARPEAAVAAKPAAKAVAKASAKTGAKPVAKAAAKPAAKPVPKAAAKPAAKPATKDDPRIVAKAAAQDAAAAKALATAKRLSANPERTGHF